MPRDLRCFRSHWIKCRPLEGRHRHGWFDWPNHVCDLKGWQNEAARAYGVSSIPHALLVDQNGTIAATHLRGPALAAKLNELLR